MKLTGKLVLVTGASSGVGRATALQLAQNGFYVLAGVRCQEAGRALKAKAKGRLDYVLLDVTSTPSIESLGDTVSSYIEDGYQLWGVVNNAGICYSAPLELASLSLVRQQFEVNVFGCLAVAQQCLPFLHQSNGRIINISDGEAAVEPAFRGPYAASKAALEALSDAMREELAEFGIAVSVVVPGPVVTTMWGKVGQSVSRFVEQMEPQERSRYAQPMQRAMDHHEKVAFNTRTRLEDIAGLIQWALTTKRPKSRYEVGLESGGGRLMSKLLPY